MRPIVVEQPVMRTVFFVVPEAIADCEAYKATTTKILTDGKQKMKVAERIHEQKLEGCQENVENG